MAIWQYDLFLIPEAAVELDVDLPATIEDPDLRGRWERTQPPPGFPERVERILPEFDSWDPDLRWWGSEEGNRIDVWSRDGEVTEVRVRIDVRSLDKDFLKGILLLATEWGCLLWSPESETLFRPEAEDLVMRLRECDAQVFLMDLRRKKRDS